MCSIQTGNRVVLLHGIVRGARSMGVLARRLEANGYRVLNLDYPSTRHDLATLATLIHPAISRFNRGNRGLLHVVTHSMGGLLARVYLADHRPANLGRVVMLAPPNGGSELADRHEGAAWYRWALGPAGSQLTTVSAAALPMPDYPVGIVAGSRSFYPLASRRIPGPNDGRVSIDRTKPPSTGDTDWTVVPAAHPVIMRNGEAISATLTFLKTGRF